MKLPNEKNVDFCEMENEISNRITKSSLKSIDLHEFINKEQRISFDIKDILFSGLILREKDFRDFIKNNDWSNYTDKNVRIFCSEDVIIPTWAYMLLVTKLQKANVVVQGSEDDLEKALIHQAIEKMMKIDWTNAKVVIKGCGNIQNVDYAYTEITKTLIPHVASLMFGEPCSTVPVFKRFEKVSSSES